MKTSQCTESAKPRTAMFQGSFDPFTVGHESIVRRALGLFDSIVVAVVRNVAKNSLLTPEQRVHYIRRVFDDCPNVQVVCSEGLTVDVARHTGAQCLLRGVRSMRDYEYEMAMAQVNRDLSGIETVLLFTLPEHAHISSSLVRELMSFKADVSRYIPLPLSVIDAPSTKRND